MRTLLVLLAVLATLVVEHAPWRLMALLAEVPFVDKTAVRLPDQNTRYWDVQDLEQQLREQGWTVEYTSELDEGTKGETDSRARSIRLSDKLPWDARLAVLAHEAGHTQQPVWATHNQSEAYAELAAALIAHDGLREHARYLARMRGDVFLLAVMEWRALYRTAESMESR